MAVWRGDSPVLIGRMSTVERVLLVIQSTLSFLSILRGMMGFPEYGHFVLMLMQVKCATLGGVGALYERSVCLVLRYLHQGKCWCPVLVYAHQGRCC